MTAGETWRKSRASRFAPLGLLLCASVFACAKVADPIPPVVQLPASIADLEVKPLPNRTEVVFSLPEGRISWVEVYRHCDPSTPPSRFHLITRIGPGQLRDSSDPGRFSYLDRETNPACRYGVRFVDDRGLRSPFSNIAASITRDNP